MSTKKRISFYFKNILSANIKTNLWGEIIKMKKWLGVSFIFPIFAFLCFSAFGRKTITVGTTTDLPPFSFHENGIHKGFDFDLINAIGKKINYHIVIKDLPFRKLEGALLNDEVDIIMAGITITDNRKKDFNFSDPYFNNTQVLLSKNKNFNFKNNKIGILEGRTNIFNNKDFRFKSFCNLFKAVDNLKENNIDFLAMDISTAYYFAKKYNLEIINPNLPTTNYGIGIHKKNSHLLQEINKALISIKDEGIYDEIFEKHF